MTASVAEQDRSGNRDTAVARNFGQGTAACADNDASAAVVLFALRCEAIFGRQRMLEECLFSHHNGHAMGAATGSRNRSLADERENGGNFNGLRELGAFSIPNAVGLRAVFPRSRLWLRLPAPQK